MRRGDWVIAKYPVANREQTWQVLKVRGDVVLVADSILKSFDADRNLLVRVIPTLAGLVLCTE